MLSVFSRLPGGWYLFLWKPFTTHTCPKDIFTVSTLCPNFSKGSISPHGFTFARSTLSPPFLPKLKLHSNLRSQLSHFLWEDFSEPHRLGVPLCQHMQPAISRPSSRLACKTQRTRPTSVWLCFVPGSEWAEKVFNQCFWLSKEIHQNVNSYWIWAEELWGFFIYIFFFGIS